MSDFYITPTLLNAWLYYIHSREESEDVAKKSFLNCLEKIKQEPTSQMKRGIEFENSIRAFDENNEQCEDITAREICNIIKGGLWQEKIYKTINVDGIEILLYGIADIIKQNKIYDIKRVSKYQLPKYYRSSQHKIYLYCTDLPFFDYLISDGKDVYIESYSCSNINILEHELKTLIRSFLNWLKLNNYYDIYTKNWEGKKHEHN